MGQEASSFAQPQGLSLWQGSVLPDWLDYNGHMTEHRYLQVFGESSDALYAQIGVDFERADLGAYFTLETHIRHRAEAKLAMPLYSLTQILGYDGKRLHLWHELFDDQDQLLATGEHLCLHMAHGKASEATAQMLAKIAAIYGDQQKFDLPPDAGRVLRKPLAYQRAALLLKTPNPHSWIEKPKGSIIIP